MRPPVVARFTRVVLSVALHDLNHPHTAVLAPTRKLNLAVWRLLRGECHGRDGEHVRHATREEPISIREYLGVGIQDARRVNEEVRREGGRLGKRSREEVDVTILEPDGNEVSTAPLRVQ